MARLYCYAPASFCLIFKYWISKYPHIVRLHRIYLLILYLQLDQIIIKAKQEVELLLSAGGHYIININPANAISISCQFSVLKAARAGIRIYEWHSIVPSILDLGPVQLQLQLEWEVNLLNLLEKSIKNHKRLSLAQ